MSKVQPKNSKINPEALNSGSSTRSVGDRAARAARAARADGADGADGAAWSVSR
ncbi:hypothetical protein CLV30_104276 [Haloactinopolyspora alba]|uniref:Uncharacterized protein n=1 Tax=Haloactinopolyspora alba TaxID=648780 RepID=A0A2P8E7G2_9ACTN|nr:hypothetical protein CLV30_104276 [Haloactinopolyspora alba]